MAKKTNSHLKNRQIELNRVAKDDAITNRKQRKRRDDENTNRQRRPKQGRHRGNVFFNTDYAINFLSLIALIGNTILRVFKGDYIFILPNVLFLFFFVFMASYMDPRRLASDNKTHIRPNMNMLYARIRMDMNGVLQRVGQNLDVGSIGTLNLVFITTVITSILSMFTYGSSFTAVSIPLLLLYVMRLFAGNSFRKDSTNIGVYKWILFMILVIQSAVSAWGLRIAFDYTLFIMISLFNSLHVFMKHTYIYGRHEVPGEGDE